MLFAPAAPRIAKFMRRSVIFLLLALALALAASAYLWRLGDERAAGRQQPMSSEEDTAVTIGGPFSLIDQDGRRRSEQDFRGRFMLVFFGYTYCPDVCPTSLAVIAATLERLGADADRLVPVMISVDPKRDTPEILKSYLAAFGSRFVGLTGSETEIATAAKAFRVYYNPMPNEAGTLDHSSVIYLMDPGGVFVANYSLQTPPDDMANDIKAKLIAAP